MTQIDPTARVCIHEAGHAVMMKCEGMKVKRVEINREAIAAREGMQGVVTSGNELITRTTFAKVSVAGAVAESIAFGCSPVRRLNRLSDGGLLEEVMVENKIPKRERAAERRRVIALVDKRLRKHFNQVVAIAEEVGTHDVCEEKRVNEIMKVK